LIFHKSLSQYKINQIMPVTREVYSVKIQMILSLIPVVDLWAAYRIEKLRLWVLYWIGMSLISVSLMVIGDETIEIIIGMAIGIPIAIFLMRHFTMEWNKKIQEETKNSFQNKTPQDSEP